MPLTYLTGVINEFTDKVKSIYQYDIPLGLLVQPLTADYLDRAAHYDWVGIDNGCFSEVGRRKFNLGDYLNLIEHALSVAKPDGVLFATAPDEPFDWEATLRKSLPVLRKITAVGEAHQKRNSQPIGLERERMLARMGMPVWYNIAAIVLQDGATPETVPWDLVGTVFVGGSTEWKLGVEAHALVKEAHRRRKHVHMGRVNSMKRMLLCQRWGVDSADGTYLMYTDPCDGTFDIMEWLRENWRRYQCHHCGVANPFCICGGLVDHLTREEIEARYDLPEEMSGQSARQFIRNHVARARRTGA